MSANKNKGMDLGAFQAHQDQLRDDREKQLIEGITGDLDDLVAKIELDKLVPDPYQPRKNFSPDKLEEMARSLQEHGLNDPLIVRPAQGPGLRGKYWIVSGERRKRAAELLGWKTIDCRIKNLDPIKAAVVAIVMNIHREDLSEIEKAEHLQRLKTMTSYTHKQVAEMVGISEVYARQLASLLNVSDPVKNLVRSGELATRTAIALKALPEDQQLEWANKAISEGLTAEKVRSATADVVRPRITRNTPDLEVPRSIENAPAYQPVPQDTPPAARSGTKTKLIEDSITAVKNIRKLVDRESWAPSEMTMRQRELIHEFYQELSQLHQEVVYIRAPIKDEEEQKRKDPKNLLRA